MSPPAAPQDGHSRSALFANANTSLTYADILLLPGYIDFPASSVILQSKFSKRITLNRPWCASPMDTITGGEMAREMAVRSHSIIVQ